MLMKHVSIILPLLFASAIHADEPVDSRTKYVICASNDDAPFVSSLFRILRGDDRLARFEKTTSIAKAATSDADIIVAVAQHRGQLIVETDDKIIEQLKQKKIIGIGYGAAELFGVMGLEINGGACAHFGNRVPKVLVGSSRLLGESTREESIQPLKDNVPDEFANTDVFAMHLPPTGADAQVVDAIARFERKQNYAPIVHQGNCVLIGIPITARYWSEPYSKLMRQLCMRLHQRQQEAFSVAQRELTESGTYEFELQSRGSVEKPFSKEFFFRFASPTRLKVRLEHSGSNNVMMLFMGNNSRRPLWTRKDASMEETLSIDLNVEEEDIKVLGKNHWKLEVTNFGNTQAKCKLTVDADAG